MKHAAHTILLLIIAMSTVSAQESGSSARSAIQFRDTTGTEKTAKIGWTGDAESGHFFVQTPNEGKVLRSNADGMEIKGTVKADRFSGDGSGLTNLPTEETGISDVSGLEDALDDKADKNTVGRKADTGWVKEQLEDLGAMADSASVAARLSGKADTGWVKTTVDDAVSAAPVADDAVDSSKIVDGGISGTDIDPGTRLTVGDLSVGGNIGIGSDTPNSTLDVKGSLEVGTASRGMSITSSAQDNFFLLTHTNTPNPNITIGYGNGSGELDDSRESIYMNNGTFGFRNGNIGIGSTAPTSKLEISMINPDGWSGNLDALKIFAPDAAYWLGLHTYIASEKNMVGYSFSPNGEHGTLSLTTTGNVGIGTTDPQDKLHIVDDWRDNSTDDWGGGIRITGDYPTVSFWETDNGAHRWMWHLSNDIMNLYRRPNGGDWQRLAYFNHNGDLYLTGTVTSTSDRRYKTDITPLTSSLDKITALQGVNYLWNRVSFPHRNFSERLQIGLIAQDVEKVIPEVISTDNQGYKSLAYDRLVPVLIEAVKEQKKIVERQNDEIQKLRGELLEIKTYLGLQ